MMNKPSENIVNAGKVFMLITWLQGQMSDLIIFQKYPNLIPDFVANRKQVLSQFFKKRVVYWEMSFGKVKNEFKKEFSNLLTNDEKKDLEEIYHLRNSIAHAHVSLGRDYLLYRPSGGDEREQQLIDDLNLQPIDNKCEPMVLLLELWGDNLSHSSKLIERFDQITLQKIANELGVPHGRIR